MTRCWDSAFAGHRNPEPAAFKPGTRRPWRRAGPPRQRRSPAAFGGDAVKATGAIGYAELLEMPESLAAPLIELRTRQYARRQRTWFRRETALQWASGPPNHRNVRGSAFYA